MKLNLDKLRNTLRTTLIDIWEYVIPIWKISGLFKRIKSKKDLGKNFGHSLTEIEVDWLLKNEFAKSVDDILWRRTKLGLKFNDSEKNKLEHWLKYKI